MCANTRTVITNLLCTHSKALCPLRHSNSGTSASVSSCLSIHNSCQWRKGPTSLVGIFHIHSKASSPLRHWNSGTPASVSTCPSIAFCSLASTIDWNWRYIFESSMWLSHCCCCTAFWKKKCRKKMSRRNLKKKKKKRSSLKPKCMMGRNRIIDIYCIQAIGYHVIKLFRIA